MLRKIQRSGSRLTIKCYIFKNGCFVSRRSQKQVNRKSWRPPYSENVKAKDRKFCFFIYRRGSSHVMHCFLLAVEQVINQPIKTKE